MSHCIVGSRDRWEFPSFSKGHSQFPCSALTTGKCLPLGLCKGIVKESCPYLPISPHGDDDMLHVR